MKRKILRRLLLVLILAQTYLLSFAHSGRTDSSGGHHDRRNGGYHYHNSGEDNSAGIVVIWILVGLLVIGFIAKAGSDKDK